MDKKLPSMLNQERIMREVYEDETQSLRTKIVSGFETEIELNHADGDSVYVVRKTISVPANQEVDCREYSKLCAFENGSILISPELEGDEWLTIQVEAGKVIDLCAMRVKPLMKCVLKA